MATALASSTRAIAAKTCDLDTLLDRDGGTNGKEGKQSSTTGLAKG
jgi:hypothetical protein